MVDETTAVDPIPSDSHARVRLAAARNDINIKQVIAITLRHVYHEDGTINDNAVSEIEDILTNIERGESEEDMDGSPLGP